MAWFISFILVFGGTGLIFLISNVRKINKENDYNEELELYNEEKPHMIINDMLIPKKNVIDINLSYNNDLQIIEYTYIIGKSLLTYNEKYLVPVQAVLLAKKYKDLKYHPCSSYSKLFYFASCMSAKKDKIQKYITNDADAKEFSTNADSLYNDIIKNTRAILHAPLSGKKPADPAIIGGMVDGLIGPVAGVATYIDQKEKLEEWNRKVAESRFEWSKIHQNKDRNFDIYNKLEKIIMKYPEASNYYESLKGSYFDKFAEDESKKIITNKNIYK